MSGVILEFLEPYRQFARDEDAFAKLVALGVVAWNVALVPAAEREQALEEFAVAAFGEGRPSIVARVAAWVRARMGRVGPGGGETGTRDQRALKATIRGMVERKLEEFPDNHRFIVDYRVAGDGEQAQLFVVSTLERPRLSGEQMRGRRRTRA
jgi:hypothetical protein